jgi:hypothetical protein
MSQEEHDLQLLVQKQLSVFQLSDERLRRVLIIALGHLRGNRR